MVAKLILKIAKKNLIAKVNSNFGAGVEVVKIKKKAASILKETAFSLFISFSGMN